MVLIWTVASAAARTGGEVAISRALMSHGWITGQTNQMFPRSLFFGHAFWLMDLGSKCNTVMHTSERAKHE
jgi:hypothetical protein